MENKWLRRLLRLKHAYDYHQKTFRGKVKGKEKSKAQRAYDVYCRSKSEIEVCDEYQLIKVGRSEYAYQDDKNLIFMYDDYADDGYTYRADLSEEYKDVYVFEAIDSPYRKISIVYNSDGTVYKHTNKEYHYDDIYGEEISNMKETFYYPENTTVEQILQSK